MLTLPDRLRPFSALDVERVRGTHYAFKTTSLETLLDAPVLAGRYAAQLSLTGAVSLDIVAQRPEDLQVPPARVAELQALLVQVAAVFGPPPFARYAILARLSDEGASGGTEHRASSENGLASSHFQDWPGQLLARDLIAHEIVHDWNGFYRTPADSPAPRRTRPRVPIRSRTSAPRCRQWRQRTGQASSADGSMPTTNWTLRAA